MNLFRIRTICMYFFSLMLIMSTNSIYYTISGGSWERSFIIIGTIILSFILSIISLYLMYVSNTNIAALIRVFISYAVISFLLLLISKYKDSLNNENILLLLVFPLAIIPFLFYERRQKRIIILVIFKRIVIFLGIVSLFFWLFSIIGISTNMVSKTILWGYYHQVKGYFGIHFISQSSVNFLGIRMIRNTGLFAEAPMFSYVVSLALLIHLFLENGNKIWDYQTVLLCLVNLSTTSTTGLIIMIVGLFAKMYSLNKSFIKLFQIFLLPIVVLIVFVVWRMKIENMPISFNIRWDDIQSGFYDWLLHPFFGNGLNNNTSIKMFMNPTRLYLNGNDGYSSGFMEMLALGGLYYAFFWGLFPIVKFGRENFCSFCFAFLFLTLTVVTLVNNTYVYVFFILFFIV